EGVPSAPLLDRMELLGNEQIISNDSILRTDYEGFGEVRQAKPAARFSETPSEISRPAPKLGEHSFEILCSLGYDQSSIDKLVNNNIVVASKK
ncbi:MAG: CoA transferase, partial [Gammaproteobacteria bacterium]